MAWETVELSIATKEDIATLECFDYTKLTAINTCPTYGILRYSHHKVMRASVRAVALDAGKVMHDCFAVIRLASLGHKDGQNLRDHMNVNGVKQFGVERWGIISEGWQEDDISLSIRNMALQCLSTSDFEEDPSDKRRTYNNLENSLLYYCQRWEPSRYPIYVGDPGDTSCFVGVEIAFAIRVSPCDATPFIYTGRIDGLHVDRRGNLLIQENKTASTLNQAWREAFIMSHQVTGYCIAGSLTIAQPIDRALVMGLQIPLPRSVYDGFTIEQVERPTHQRTSWLQWLEHTKRLHDQYKLDVSNAPRYTHSCNRYFRPCSFIPYCASDADERVEMFNIMPVDEWSPLHTAGDDA